MNILEACRDPELFAQHFEGDTWKSWFEFLAAVFGLGVNDMDLYRQCTGRESAPEEPVREAWLIIGRRGGKSKVCALVAVYLATFFDYRQYLSAGEWGMVSITASDKLQARVIMRYIEALISETPLLSQIVTRQTQGAIELSNKIAIEVKTASIKSVRGYTLVAAINDEIAFWRSDESAQPDVEILNAQRPASASIPNAMHLNLSSPYARRGAMWDAFKRYYGTESKDVLVWKAPTWTMNPSISEDFLLREQRRDPESYKAEYAAEFRSDIAAALDQAWIDEAMIRTDLDLPKSPHSRPYVGFVDMSGGRSDAAAIAIAHIEPDQPFVIVDALRRFKPPFSQDSVVQQMAELLSHYGLSSVKGDNYGADFVVDIFRKAGITYERSQDSASDLYLQCIPLFSAGTLQLPDNKILRAELTALERRTRVSGKDLVTHPPGQHDDLANVVCAAAVLAWRARQQGFEIILGSPMQTALGEGSLTTDVDRLEGLNW